MMVRMIHIDMDRDGQVLVASFFECAEVRDGYEQQVAHQKYDDLNKAIEAAMSAGEQGSDANVALVERFINYDGSVGTFHSLAWGRKYDWDTHRYRYGYFAAGSGWDEVEER